MLCRAQAAFETQALNTTYLSRVQHKTGTAYRSARSTALEQELQCIPLTDTCDGPKALDTLNCLTVPRRQGAVKTLTALTIFFVLFVDFRSSSVSVIVVRTSDCSSSSDLFLLIWLACCLPSPSNQLILLLLAEEPEHHQCKLLPSSKRRAAGLCGYLSGLFLL